MTETDTRDGVAFVLAALAVLFPTCILLVLALLGGEVPHGRGIALFAIPGALLLATVGVGARLGHR